MCNRPQPENRLKPGSNMHTHLIDVARMPSHNGGAVSETVKGRTDNLTSTSKSTQMTEIRIA